MNNNIGYEHTLLGVDEVLKMKLSLLSWDSIEIGIFVWSVILWFILVLYVFPILHIMKNDYVKGREKKMKKNLLRQITMQREIEEEVEKSLK